MVTCGKLCRIGVIDILLMNIQYMGTIHHATAIDDKRTVGTFKNCYSPLFHGDLSNATLCKLPVIWISDSVYINIGGTIQCAVMIENKSKAGTIKNRFCQQQRCIKCSAICRKSTGNLQAVKNWNFIFWLSPPKNMAVEAQVEERKIKIKKN